MIQKISSFKSTKPVLWNMIIFAIAMVISQSAIECFNVVSTLFTLKASGSVWASVLVQIFRYIPTLLSFAIAPIIIKKFNNRLLIVIAEYVSAFVILFVCVIGFIYGTQNITDSEAKNVKAITYTVYVAVIIWNIFNSVRFLALKNIVYRLSVHEKNINIFNRINNFATSFSYLAAALASLGLIHILSYEYICLILGLTYIISALLYNTFVVFDKDVEISSKPKIKKHSKTFIYTAIILISLAVFSSISFVPRIGTNTNFVINLFMEAKTSNSVQHWVTIYLIVVGAALCLGSLVIFLLGKKILISTSIAFVVVTIISSIFYIYAFGGLNTNIGVIAKSSGNSGVIEHTSTWAHEHKNIMLGIFLTSTFIQYFLFSMFLPVYYDYSYRAVPSEKYAFFAAITMILFQLVAFAFSLGMISIFEKINYQTSYLVFAITLTVLVIIATVVSVMLKKRQRSFTKDHNLKPENEML